MAKKAVSKQKEKKNTQKVKLAISTDKKTPLIIGVVAIIIIAIIVAIVFTKNTGKSKNVEPVANLQELSDKLNVKMVEPSDGSNVKYGIEKGNIARMDYQKKASDGSMMNFTLRSSSSTEENGLSGLTNEWGTPILMTVICKDGAEVEVTSYVATDDNFVMKGDWYDNDKYYSMTTDNLVTREDFLQEVNRVIIANHVTF